MNGDSLLFGDDETPAPGGRVSQADRLVRLAEARYTFGVSETGDVYGVPLEGPRIARMIRGSATSLRAELGAAFYRDHHKSASASSLADAVNCLHGFALSKEPTTLYLRQAWADDELWIDLCDTTGRAVRVTPAGWEIRPEAPVTFRRSELVSALPAPEKGDVNELRSFLNVGDESWALILGWLVSAHFDVPHPILALTGEQGSAKSSTARLLTALVDPSPASLRSAPRDVGEWVVTAAGSFLVALDNLSGLPPWLSDALCRAVTGDGLPRRALYSNDELIVTAFRRAILLTGIDFGVLSADLIDRCVFCELDRITNDRRQLDSEIRRRFAAAQPRILGGLLDAVSATMRELPNVELTSFPRMADHARILAALDLALDTDCLAAYETTAGRAMLDAAEGNPIADAVLAFMADREEWTGTASALLAAITPDFPPSRWPKTAHHLSAQVKRLSPVLRASGVEVERHVATTSDRSRLISLTRPIRNAERSERLIPLPI